MASSMMNGYKVLDLTDKKGFLVGKLLVDLGMEVIKVERPGGDPDRMQPPYYKGEEKPENSLYFEAYNMNKKSVTLDIEKEEGRKVFLDMVKKVDFVIESFDPGYLDSIGLGYKDVSAVKPDIIMASLTPFGQKGPDAGLHIDDDLVLQSLSTMLKRSGDPDRAPLKITDYRLRDHGERDRRPRFDQRLQRTRNRKRAQRIRIQRRRTDHTDDLALQGWIHRFPAPRRKDGTDEPDRTYAVDDRRRRMPGLYEELRLGTL